MKLLIDIDGTICTLTDGEYEKTMPFKERIEHFNKLYDEGFTIGYWTARGGNSGKDWSAFTEKQLSQWGVKYHSFQCGKPSYDLWIDDKAINSEDFFDDFANRP